MSNMQPFSGRGFNPLIVPLILAVLLLIGAAGFGAWAYNSRQDYKNNTEAKINAAVATATDKEADAKDAAFAEESKRPLKTYTGPAAYGSVVIKFPKTWSAYVSDDTNGSPFVDGYFYPNVVPNVQSVNSAFALRVQVVQDSYSNVLNGLQGLIQTGKTTIIPYKAANVSNVVGVRLDGSLSEQKSGSMVIFPLRDKTLKLWTETPQFKDDFDSNILPNFSFSP